MKYHVSITKREVITAIIFILGLVLLFKGLHAAYKHSHALNLETLDEHELKEGDYVIGDINTYIGQIMYGSNQFSGVSQTHLTYTKAYNFYTVPARKNSYVCIMAYSESLLDQLKAFENGHGKEIHFEGIVVNFPTELNYNWYAYIDGFDTEDLIDSYAIKEANFGRNKFIIYWGILLLVIAALLFFSAGGIKNFVMVDVGQPDYSRSAYNTYAKSYNKDNELLAAKKQLETLEQRLRSLKRSAVIGFISLLLGVYIVFSAYLLEVKLFGMALILISFKGIWKYFINSSNTLAISMAKKITLKSLSLQIKERQENIKKMEEMTN